MALSQDEGVLFAWEGDNLQVYNISSRSEIQGISSFYLGESRTEGTSGQEILTRQPRLHFWQFRNVILELSIVELHQK